MTKFLALGMSLDDVLARVTWGPACAMGWGDRIGTLWPGMPADIALLRIQEGEFTLRDAGGDVLKTDRRIVPVITVRAGECFEPVACPPASR